jgi:nucleolar complex protein 2
LKQTDANLLDFDDSEDEDDGEANKRTAKKLLEKKGEEEFEDDGKKGKRLTTKLVTAWCAAAKTGSSFQAVRRLLQAYRAACHFGDPEQTGEDEESAGGRLVIASSGAFNELLLFVLREAMGMFNGLLGVAEGAQLTKLVRSTLHLSTIKNYIKKSAVNRRRTRGGGRSSRLRSRIWATP